MKDKCDLCSKNSVTVLTINIPSETSGGIRQWNTYRCSEHTDVGYNAARKIIDEKVSNKLKAIHEKCTNNRKLIENSVCGCFYCLEIFDGNDVVEFIDKGNTARCPGCGADTVIASDADETVTKAMLTAMHKHYF